jgi:hypothetical protein
VVTTGAGGVVTTGAVAFVTVCFGDTAAEHAPMPTSNAAPMMSLDLVDICPLLGLTPAMCWIKPGNIDVSGLDSTHLFVVPLRPLDGP